MTIRPRTFSIFVIFAVVLTGAGFGALTGSVYDQGYWWAGMAAGAIGGFALAILYLAILRKMSGRGYSDKKTALSGTLVSALCGVACTVLVHAVMIMIVVNRHRGTPTESSGDFSPNFAFQIGAIIVFVGLVIGIVAGVFVGGISSLIYVLFVKDKDKETA